MRVKLQQTKLIILVSLGLLLSLAIASCELTSPNAKLPATPTIPLDIPVITAEPTQDGAEDAEEAPVAEDVVASAEEETEEESSEESAEAAPTETPQPQSEAESSASVDDSEAVAEEAVVYEATPTVIPAKSDENPDPMVYVYGAVNCYASPDTSSTVTGKTKAGTALATHQRSWNFYQIDHPTVFGTTCWVTGDAIRPNTEAFALTGPTPMPPSEVTIEETEEVAEEADAGEEEVAVVEPTPTAIPYVNTENPDPMVIFYGKTNCYKDADEDSDVSGVAYGGMALGAFKRDWNWYQIVHPTTGGLVCWVTGDTIRPNQTAYNLGN